MSSRTALRTGLRNGLGPSRILVWVLGAIISVYLLVPVLILLPLSLTQQGLLIWPPELLSTRWFSAFFESPAWMEPLLTSLRVALPVTIIATVLGTLAALGVMHARRRRSMLQVFFVGPLILPIITYALGLYDVSGWLGIRGSIWPVVLGQTMLATPLVFIAVSAGLAGRDRQLPLAAASLGAPGWVVLWRIELPLIRASIVAGAFMALAYSFDEIVIALFLLPPGETTLPVQLFSASQQAADPTIAAAAMAIVGLVLTILAIGAVVRAILVARKRAT